MSTERMSPRLSLYEPGIPWTIIESGEGTTHAESGEIPIKPGDIVLIPAGEKHMTRNTGNVPLVLLCFFPMPDVSAATTEFSSF